MSGRGPSQRPDEAQLFTRIDELVTEGQLGVLDRDTAAFFSRHARNEPVLAAALGAGLSALRKQGHVCLDLDAKPLPPIWRRLAWDLDPDPERLRATGLVSEAGRPGPVVMEGARLWLHRAWRVETELAAALRRLALRQAISPPLVEPVPWLDEPQNEALARALGAALFVVSGGPGTGKTTLAAAIMAELMRSGRIPADRIGLAAPTGKAAARLEESVNAALARARLPESGLTARTLHRLLGWNPTRRRFRHDADRHLPLDLVLVDECSMVDMDLMYALVRALHPEASLLLLGDRDQLASVAPGSVMADLCGGIGQAGPLASQVTLLETSYRFSEESGIAALSQAIRSGDAGRVLEVLGGRYSDLLWVRPGEVRDPEVWLDEVVPASWPGGLGEADVARALEAVPGFRILCAHRGGPLGTRRFNERMRRWLAARAVVRGVGAQYHNRLLMVTGNDYSLRVFNGDVGLLRETSGRLQAWFDGGPEPRAIPAERLLHTETAYAMTVHKSQGSEFDRVLAVLPDAESPLLTRELLYTAVTRARSSLVLLADEESVRVATDRLTRRHSGLAQRLWTDPGSTSG